jgi:hypothetical protein
MKLYVIVMDEISDFEKYPQKPEVYYKKEDAERRVNELYDEVKPMLSNYNIEERTSTSFSLYTDGSYPENHFDVTLYEVEMK